MPTPRAAPVAFVLETVAADFGMTADDLKAHLRFEPIDTVRMMAIRLAREVVYNDALKGGNSEKVRLSYERIGKVMGRDHSTIRHAHVAIGNRLRQNAWLRQRYERLKAHIETSLYPQERHLCDEYDDCETTAGEASSSA